MPAQLIDGLALSKKLRLQIAQQAQALNDQGLRPGLAVVLVGEDPASQVYVRNKIKACEETGIHSVLQKLPAQTSQEELLGHIATLNADTSIHGILVQLPLPKHLDADAVIEAIAPEKDVDGFHVASAGALMTGLPGGFWPCTPHGCLQMLDAIGYELRGKHAVVVGRSNIVGKPMAMMLLARSATVTICHSATADLGAITRQADVLVAAVGKEKLITREMVKPGAVVIDVGMNRNAQGKLCGDVDFEQVQQVASWITPVPGGVGPMTITMLLANTIESAQRAAGKN